MVKQNFVERCGGGGVVMEDEATAERIVVENNQIADTGPGPDDGKTLATGVRIVNAVEARVAGNTIVRLARQSLQSTSRVAIQVVGTREAHVCGNDLNEIGPLEAVKDTVGVEAWPPVGLLEVTGNTIRRGALPGGATNWVALRVPAPATDFRGGDLLLVPVEGKTFVLTKARVRLLAAPRDHAAVCGNLVEAWGGTAAPVDLTIDGSCTFAHNRCVLLAETDVPAVVLLTADSAVVSSNYVQRPSDSLSARLRVKDPRRITVLGNIVFGPLRVNEQPLQPPWDPLNVISAP
jgi:hypothetical protein